jgi:hypothetical protein
VALPFVVALAAVTPVAWAGTAASAAAPRQVAASGSFGCKTDTIASVWTDAGTYTATEKTCVEATGDGWVRAHGVTRCYRSGQPFRCHSIYGFNVHTHLWVGNTLVARTAPGDDECFNCFENSHYSQNVCVSGGPATWQAREENLGVTWVPGVSSSLHRHTSKWVEVGC